ncbi:MAG: hypothetical protein MJ055_04865 [Phascolarctobacterium sp.]|nr:hypothetical protein [Phascolarctobacterium sp.]
MEDAFDVGSGFADDGLGEFDDVDILGLAGDLPGTDDVTGYTEVQVQDYSTTLSSIDAHLVDLIVIGSTLQGLLLLMFILPLFKSLGRRIVGARKNGV